MADKDVEKRVIATLERVRPYIQRDGGDMEFLSMDDDGVVTLRLLGACVGCGLIDYTLKGGVELILMDEVPEVTQVIAVE